MAIDVHQPKSPRRVVVLGSTGSIGTNTLDVAAALPDHVQIVGLVAHSRWQDLAEQCQKFRPHTAVLTHREAFDAADRNLFPRETKLEYGDDAACKLVASSDVDVVVSAIVGAAGLRGTWSAIEAGKTIALANKETLVVGGPLVMQFARTQSGYPARR